MTIFRLFLCENLSIEEVVKMFSEELLEIIFTNPKTYNIPLEFQTIMIEVIEEAIKTHKGDIADVSELLSTTNADGLSTKF